MSRLDHPQSAQCCRRIFDCMVQEFGYDNALRVLVMGYMYPANDDYVSGWSWRILQDSYRFKHGIELLPDFDPVDIHENIDFYDFLRDLRKF